MLPPQHYPVLVHPTGTEFFTATEDFYYFSNLYPTTMPKLPDKIKSQIQKTLKKKLPVKKNQISLCWCKNLTCLLDSFANASRVSHQKLPISHTIRH